MSKNDINIKIPSSIHLTFERDKDGIYTPIYYNLSKENKHESTSKNRERTI